MRMLEVVQVGNFEASFVPTENDFLERLDPRFRLPTAAPGKNSAITKPTALPSSN